ncbi:MAG: hypothetical protein ACR2N3_00670 [Pyrinomonadaceae bacterium]
MSKNKSGAFRQTTRILPFFRPLAIRFRPKRLKKMGAESHEIRVQSRTWKVSSAFDKQIIRLFLFSRRLKKFVLRDYQCVFINRVIVVSIIIVVILFTMRIFIIPSFFN